MENTNNIMMLIDTIKNMNKKIYNIERRLQNISKKTKVVYKNTPNIVKRSIWKRRLRSYNK